MYINHNSKSIRLTGRWDTRGNRAVTTAPGAMIECAFTGKTAVVVFDTEHYIEPHPHIWVSLDNGNKFETSVDSYLRIEAGDDGEHYLKIIFKSAVEIQHRWYDPLIGKLDFRGIEVEKASKLPEDDRKIIEFLGDSITEGVLIDEFIRPDPVEQKNRVFQDDSTATYAYLTAMALNMKPVIMGYGATGITKRGCGAVPRAIEAYPYVYNGCPFEGVNPYMTVINYGTNDWDRVDECMREYPKLLDLVRKINLDTKMVVLSPLGGYMAEELKNMVEEYNREKNENVIFINSKGWISREPVHPLRDGHRVAAEHLTEELKKIL